MPVMKTPEELFEHELKDVYYAEKVLEKVLPQLASEATSRQLASAFKRHHAETQKQIKNLERVFSDLGKPAQGESCPGIDGIKAEHDKFMQEEDATQDVRDMFLTGAAARTEHYEIAAYTGLVSKARSLGRSDAVKLLNENLKQEKETLKKIETISKDLLKAAKPNGGRPRSSGSRRRSSSTRSSSRSRTTSRRSSGSRSR
jgi:ferritin-like metal-binding protein YciE